MQLDSLISSIVWVSIAGNLLLGLFVTRSKYQSTAHRSLVVHAVVMAFWSMCLYFFAHPVLLSSEQWLRMVYLLVLVMAGALLHFSLVFPLSRKKNAKPYMIVWFFCSIFFAYFILCTKLFLVTVTQTPTGYLQVLGPMYIVFSIVGTFNVFLTIANYVQSYRVVLGREKVQLQYTFLGVSVFALTVTGLDVVLPVVFHTSQYIWASGAAAIIFVGSITYVIIRHRLLDIDVILRRGTIYSLLLITSMALYAITVSIMTSRFTISLSQIVASLVLTVTIFPIREFFEIVTDRYFFKRHYTFESAVKELTKILLTYPRLDDLLSNILSLIHRLLKTEYVIAFIRSSEGEYTCRTQIGVTSKTVTLHRNESEVIRFFENNAKDGAKDSRFILDRTERIQELLAKGESPNGIDTDPIVSELMTLNYVIAVPLYNKQELIGIILLGDKQSGDAYGSQDMEFLEVVSQETAASMENAISFERLKIMDDVKSELISVVSHQLRTPLAVSRWNMELLLSNDYGELPNLAHDMVDKTYNALSSLNQGLNNLMIALEIEEGHPLKAVDTIDLSALFDQILKEFSRLKDQKHISVETKYEFNEALVADQMKVKIILEILIDNAFHYTPEYGSIRIETKMVRTENGRECQMSIEDNGIGISEDKRDLVFQKFYRGEEAKRTSPNGFGLGLFIARSFAQMHGGKLWIGKKETQGTIFHIALPIVTNTRVRALLPNT